jgi:hypothetical protein
MATCWSGAARPAALAAYAAAPKGVRSHVGDGRGLSRGSGGCGSCGSPHATRRSATNEPAADLLGDINFATSEGSRPGDRGPGAAIL